PLHDNGLRLSERRTGEEEGCDAGPLPSGRRTLRSLWPSLGLPCKSWPRPPKDRLWGAPRKGVSGHTRTRL
ncbi:hypothetical protein K5549_016373, partial [Capra hircus]